MNTDNLNVATSIFPGFNDRDGIFVCGYEWGGDPGDDSPDGNDDASNKEALQIPHTFSNKAVAYGNIALSSPYDQRIIKWFSMWGHPLSTHGLGGDFEKMIVQTNWCNTQAQSLKNVNIVKKLRDPFQIKNFLYHVMALQPKLILFFGIRQIECLKSPSILPQFEEFSGKCQEPLKFVTKPHSGRKFRIGFQSFENVQIIGFPHPSGTHGLSDDYIDLFTPEIGARINEFKRKRGLLTA